MGVSIPGANNAMWAHGLRNGWRASWDLPTGRYIIAEVGGNQQDSKGIASTLLTRKLSIEASLMRWLTGWHTPELA